MNIYTQTTLRKAASGFWRWVITYPVSNAVIDKGIASSWAQGRRQIKTARAAFLKRVGKQRPKKKKV